MDNQNPQDPNQGGMPVDPNAGQPAPEQPTPAPEAPVETPQQPVSEPGIPPFGGNQGGQNPQGAPMM